MLKWKEQPESSQIFSSPIILVPVRLLIESITSPYRLTLHDDEIVINPTLAHKLDNDFGISVPEFDSAHDSPEEYMERLFSKIENQDWSVERSVHLANLSFLKINMYKDLERNEEKLNDNGVISAIVGEQSTIQQIPDELNNFDHDKQVRPIDTFQVVDADSSQQDAILLSKKERALFYKALQEQERARLLRILLRKPLLMERKFYLFQRKWQLCKWFITAWRV